MNPQTQQYVQLLRASGITPQQVKQTYAPAKDQGFVIAGTPEYAQLQGDPKTDESGNVISVDPLNGGLENYDASFWHSQGFTGDAYEPQQTTEQSGTSPRKMTADLQKFVQERGYKQAFQADKQVAGLVDSSGKLVHGSTYSTKDTTTWGQMLAPVMMALGGGLDLSSLGLGPAGTLAAKGAVMGGLQGAVAGGDFKAALKGALTGGALGGVTGGITQAGIPAPAAAGLSSLASSAITGKDPRTALLQAVLSAGGSSAGVPSPAIKMLSTLLTNSRAPSKPTARGSL